MTTVCSHQLERANVDRPPLLSPLENLPKEILREIVASDLESSRAVIQSSGGCLRLKLNLSILRASQTLKSNCVDFWSGNRFVRVTYKGDACFRPTAFVPVAGDNAYRILTMPHELACDAFVADLNVAHETLSDDTVTGMPTENVCVVTVDAACTWLIILGCNQLAEYTYDEEPPLFQLELFVHKEDMISSPKGGNLYEAIGLMLQSRTSLSVIMTRRQGSDITRRLEDIDIWPSPRDAIVAGGSVYGAWNSSLASYRHVDPALRPRDAQLDYCTYICKVLIGLHRLKSGSVIMENLKRPEVSLVTLRACAALLNWTYEHHRSGRDEGPLAELKESWQNQGDATCLIEGCPCLLWVGLDLAEEGIVSRDDAERNGVSFLPWLEIHRWTIALHCRRRLAEGDFTGLVDAKEHMLMVKGWMQADELEEDFVQDLESFNIAASLGIRSLANFRGIAMVDEENVAHVEVLWDSLSLEKARVGRSLEWRVQERSVVLEAARRVSHGVIFEADIVPAQLLAALSARRR